MTKTRAKLLNALMRKRKVPRASATYLLYRYDLALWPERISYSMQDYGYRNLDWVSETVMHLHQKTFVGYKTGISRNICKLGCIQSMGRNYRERGVVATQARDECPASFVSYFLIERTGTRTHLFMLAIMTGKSATYAQDDMRTILNFAMQQYLTMRSKLTGRVDSLLAKEQNAKCTYARCALESVITAIKYWVNVDCHFVNVIRAQVLRIF